MSHERFLHAADLERLVTTLVEAGIAVYGPSTVAGRCEYRRVTSANTLDLSGMPALPLKALFLPPTEALFTWRRQHDDVSLTPAVAGWRETRDEPSRNSASDKHEGAPHEDALPQAVVIGARPCDAAGVEILDKVMGWDYRDEPWFARRAAATIVALACETGGPDCFCHELGLGPDSPKGADLLLARRAGGFSARPLTDKGRVLLDRLPEPGDGVAGREEPARQEPSRGGSADVLDLDRIRVWLGSHFDDPLWDRLGLRCHGCGACASVCPTCHCFDIVDEPDGLLTGTRRRNWDACQASKFTVHASGHNPRSDQGARFRQRVLHKFSIYPQRFGELLCTGCGRCAAACPAGQNLAEILHEIAAS